MAVKQLVTQESINPNIIPMIDIMFLILLFFMLSADMGQRELADVKLPMANAVKADKPGGELEGPKSVPRLMVNVYHLPTADLNCPNFSDEAEDPLNPRKTDLTCVEEAHWRIMIKGHNLDGQQLKDTLEKEAREDAEDEKISKRRVQIRADRSAVYGYVQKVMNTCAEVGIYKVEFGAATMKKDGQ